MDIWIVPVSELKIQSSVSTTSRLQTWHVLDWYFRVLSDFNGNNSLWWYHECLIFYLHEINPLKQYYILFFRCWESVTLKKRSWRICYSLWAASSEFGTYRLCEQRRFRRACTSAQSRQNLRCSLIQAMSQEEPSDKKPDPWPLWMAGHAHLKFFMTECSKTQIRLTRPLWEWQNYALVELNCS